MTTLPKRSHNYIVIPIYYEGTPFEDNIRSIKHSIRKNNLDIHFLNFQIPTKNNLHENFDDEQYFQSQLACISHVIDILSPDSKILFLDFFNPGFDLIRYYCQLKNIVPKFGCLIHGSAFLKGDSYNWDWLKEYELAWFNTYDVIYCPSTFLKKELQPFKTKTKAFPFGIDGIKFPQSKIYKAYDVVFPHRLELDKGVDEFIEIVSDMKEVSFLVTCPQEEYAISKNPYHILLKKHKNVSFVYNQKYNQHLLTLSKCKIVLSCARQENFGYSVLKSIKCGAIPVVPNRLCYPEMYDILNRYNNKKECINKIKAILKGNNLNYESRIKNEVKYSFLPLLLNFFK